MFGTGQKTLVLQHQFASPVQTDFSVWFYDSNQTYYNFLRLENSSGTPSAFVGTQDFDPTYYEAALDTSSGRFGPQGFCALGLDCGEVPTNVRRTVGWHKLEINVGTSNFVILIDGSQVLSVPGRYTFNVVSLELFGPESAAATYYFDDFSLTPAGCQVNANDINLFAGGPDSLDGKPTSMIATFTPTDVNGLPIGLDAAKSACGVTRFNFQQTIDVWPSPSNLFPADPILAGWPPNLPFTAPMPGGSFPDPPNGGYTYNVAGTANRYPYYWPDDPTDQFLKGFVVTICRLGSCDDFTVETNSTMLLVDSPADPCLPGGSGRNCTGFARPISDLQFTTKLIGIDSNNKVVNLFVWNWISNFNGTSQGIVATSNYLPVDPGSGTGGITITSINGVPEVPPNVSCAATPNTLWPPNGKSVVVTISGRVTAGTSALLRGGTTYAVTDEYGQVQPSGGIILGDGGNYSFGVSLIAARNGGDKNGRTYTIVVHAYDNVGNVGSCSVVVTVPHDQGH